jgi:hypothetical protein
VSDELCLTITTTLCNYAFLVNFTSTRSLTKVSKCQNHHSDAQHAGLDESK